MFRNSARSIAMLTVLAAAGCASVQPGDPVMEDARLSVNAARSNPQVASYAPLELAQAVDTLRQADDLAARGGRIGEVHQLATLASQRAALAQQVARTRGDEAVIMAQRKATEAQLTADLSRRQAESAQIQAAVAQRQAEEAQRVASAMRADAYLPTTYDYRRRENERLYEANVTYVRAVVGPPQQRCWVEPALVDNSSRCWREHSWRHHRRCDRRHYRPPDWRRPRAGHRNGDRCPGRCCGRRKRRSWLGGPGLQSECPALRVCAGVGAGGLLGCHVCLRRI